jgi:hypothetical protein
VQMQMQIEKTYKWGRYCGLCISIPQADIWGKLWSGIFSFYHHNAVTLQHLFC